MTVLSNAIFRGTGALRAHHDYSDRCFQKQENLRQEMKNKFSPIGEIPLFSAALYEHSARADNSNFLRVTVSANPGSAGNARDLTPGRGGLRSSSGSTDLPASDCPSEDATTAEGNGRFPGQAHVPCHAMRSLTCLYRT
jgi:hypothetical protein